MTYKPILALDFDGVIHRYSQGWQDGTIYDIPTEGFADWARRATEHFTLVVVSSRLRLAENGAADIRDWMESHGIDPGLFEFAIFRPPAFMSIDDRAVQFQGDWSQLDPKRLTGFKPWTASLQEAPATSD